MNEPKLGISLRSNSRDAIDFEERVHEVTRFNPFSIELMGFAQDLIIDGRVVDQRISKIKSSKNS